MKSKIAFRLLSVLVLLSMLIAGCVPPPTQAPPAPATEAPAATQAPAATEAPAQTQAPAAGGEPIKIGILLPLTGNDALQGEHHKDAHQMAVDEINAAGGIKCLNGAPLQLVMGDSQGKPEQGNSETERLINQEKVVAIMGALHSGVVMPSTEIANKYKVPYIVTNAVDNEITTRGLQYVFMTRLALDTMTSGTTQFAVDNGAKTGVILVPNIVIGEAATKAWTKFMSDKGLKLAGTVVFTSGATDFSDSILKVKSYDPDVVFVIGNAADEILLTKQMQSLAYWPKMGVLGAGGGYADPSFIQNLGANANGIVFLEGWVPDMKPGTGQAISDKFQQKYGFALAGDTAASYATTLLLGAALEKSCSRDPQKLADALHSTDFTTGAWNFMWPGGISFSETGYPKNLGYVLAQIQNQKVVAVAPADIATAKPIWPVPGWDQRSAAAAPAATTAPVAASGEPVKIGILLPLTGNDALQGEHHKDAHQMAVDEINAAGGIKCLNGAPLQLVMGDSQGKPEQGNSETERLINQEKVVAIMGALHSGVVMPSTEIANKYKVPYIVTNAVDNEITTRGLQYVFMTRLALDTMTSGTTQFAVDNGAKTGVILVPNIVIGEAATKAWTKFMSDKGLKLAGTVVFTSGATDFSDSILKVKSYDPDVVFVIGNAADEILLTKQMQSLAYWPKMGVLGAGGGYADPSFIQNLGANANGIVFLEGWVPDMKPGTGQAISDKFQQKYGFALAGDTAASYATTLLLGAALEKSCSRDPQKLADALHSTDFTTGAWNFMWPGGISFSETGYPKNLGYVLAQIQNQKVVAVAPADVATAKPIWPVPGWDQR